MGMMSAGLGLIGGVVQGMGAMQAHEAQAAAYTYNAQVAERNQKVIHDQTVAAQRDKLDQSARQVYGVRAGYAAHGVSLTGSAMDVIADSFHQTTLAYERVGYAGAIQEVEEKDKQNLALMGADAEHKAGQISMVAGILSGVSSMVSSMPSGG